MANFFNEMYVDGGAEVRPHYRAFEDWLAEQPSDMLARKRAEADLIFRRVGITFAVYGSDAGTERLIPFDIIPRIIPSSEWQQLQAGLKQRVQALNLFIRYFEMRSIGQRCKVFQLPQIFIRISPVSTLCAQVLVSSMYLKITCAYLLACRTC